jgi:hypothetical protein
MSNEILEWINLKREQIDSQIQWIDSLQETYETKDQLKSGYYTSMVMLSELEELIKKD